LAWPLRRLGRARRGLAPPRVRVAAVPASPSATAPQTAHRDNAANDGDDDSTLRDLAPAPLYFGHDDAESALARLLEASAASARDAAQLD
jgi:hypothetical protein